MKRARLAFALALSALVATAAAADTLRRSFPVADGGTLTLDGGFGDVHVVTGGQGVAVEVVRDVTRLSSARAAEALRDFEVTFEQSGNDVHVRSHNDHKWHLFDLGNSLRVHYNIRVPSHYNVVLSTSGGDVILGDLAGNADCRTSGGDIDIARIAGNVVAHTSGGDLAIAESRGNIEAKTSGGSIKIGEADGTVDAKTSGGSIQAHHIAKAASLRTSGGNITIDEAMNALDATTSGGTIRVTMHGHGSSDSHLSTSGGDIVVEVSPSAGFALDAHASGGGVDCDLPVTVVGHQDEHSLAGAVNGGGPRLELRTSGGDIRLKKG